MARVVIDFPSVCQMSDNRNGKPSSLSPELLGYGSGGNRCTESCNAGIGWKLNLANVRARFARPEDFMYWLTEQRNAGRDVSAPRNGQEVVDWVNSNGGKMWAVGTTYKDIMAVVDAGNVAMAGFGDYNKLQKANGQSPYSWHDPDGDGHVLMVVGYNTDVSPNTVIVHDSLLGDNFQPTEYSWAGFQAAQFNSLSEVQIVGVPSGWSDDGTALKNPENSFVCTGDFREFIVANAWNAFDVPLQNAESVDSIEVGNPSIGPGQRQMFRFSQLFWQQAQSKDFTGILKSYLGQEALALRGALQAVQSQKDADDAQIKDLNALVAQLQAKSGNTPNPALEQALLAARNLLQPFVDAQAAIDAAKKEV